MTISVSATLETPASPDDVLAFVLDRERYRLTFAGRPLRWVLERRLRQWRQDDLVGETERFAAALAADETS